MTGEEIAQALKRLGYSRLTEGRTIDAITAFRRSLAAAPLDADVYYELGRLLFVSDDQNSVGNLFRRVLAIRPGLAEAANGLAFWFSQRGRNTEACAALRSAIAAKPHVAEFRSNLAAALTNGGEVDEAAAHAHAAIVLAPASADAHNISAQVDWRLGDAVSTAKSLRRVLRMEPGRFSAHRHLILSLLYDANTSPEALFAENRRFVETFVARTGEDVRFDNDPSPERRLTLGYVSSDFHYHTAARSILPSLVERDRTRFKVVGFADVANPDRMTEQIRNLCDDWHLITGLTDAALAALVRRARVDILVVLAGHYDRNRGLLAAHRPAPIVVSIYDGTTSALAGTDYLIADRMIVPRRSVERFTERVIGIPVLVPHTPIEGAPEIGPLPAISKGHITFGSFNHPLKITATTAAAWASVLKSVPNSRLMLKYWRYLSPQRARDRIYALLRAEGIDPERLEIVSAKEDPIGGHLAHYEHIDIALDTMPFNGSTSTFEALWMGVPVVTLLGQTMVSRWAAALIERAGHPEWIAPDRNAFVDKVVALATNLEDLARIRRSLRAEVANSRLFDAPRAVRNFERIYRAIWRRWCASQRIGG